ncbi:cytochrome b/b6 domain-containing protein [Thermodesulfobacteriota bacterium]
MKSTKFKFILNAFLFITFLFLMDEWSFLGITFHEIAGLVICLFYILHKALNWQFIKETTARLFGRISGRSRFNYIIDVLIFIGFTLIIISGMGIAKTMDFSWLGFTKENFIIWRFMHTSISMIVLILVGVHVGVHWSWVLARFKKSGSE